MLFLELLRVSPKTRVLDIGGTEFNWSLLDWQPDVTILNLSKGEGSSSLKFIVADGCNTGLKDNDFDIVFSNSVIEHVGDKKRQQAFARECRRCGIGFYVQTPNKWFPIDPHTLMPFIHWLPKSLYLKLMWISPRLLVSRPSDSEIDDFVNLKMLSKKEFAELFPGAKIVEEKFCGITKSLIAVSASREPANQGDDPPIFR